MRLPKPIATGVRYQSRTLGSVYTPAQMKAYAAKAVEAEREACIQDVRSYGGIHIYDAGKIVQAIRARGSK